MGAIPATGERVLFANGVQRRVTEVNEQEGTFLTAPILANGIGTVNAPASLDALTGEVIRIGSKVGMRWRSSEHAPSVVQEVTV